MIIRKSRLCSSDIEAVVNRWDQSIVGDFKYGFEANYEPVSRLFDIR